MTLAPPKVLGPEEASRALAAFRISCSVLTRRADRSGLAQPGDWRGVCAEAATLSPEYAPGFFYYRFDWVRVGDGKAFATGYYEPEIAGSRVKAPGYEVPIYRVPPDLIRCTRADGGTGRGRIDPTGQCVLYFTRAEIEDGALAGRGLELAWAADPVELFFLQIQGSGQVKLPTGRRCGSATPTRTAANMSPSGDCCAIAASCLPGGASMQAIVDWMRANPEAGRALMRENLSYIFFRELDGPPLGALGVPVTPRGTVAADPAFVPLGAPVYLGARSPGSERPVGRAGHRRRDQGPQPLRHLLGRRRRRDPHRGRHVRFGPGADPAAKGRAARAPAQP